MRRLRPPLFSPAPVWVRPIITNCTTNTAVGHLCKNHNVPGPQFCKAHGGCILTPGNVVAHGTPLANTNAGSQPLHDGRLQIGTALIAEADKLFRDGKIHTGLAHSIITDHYDPQDDLPDW